VCNNEQRIPRRYDDFATHGNASFTFKPGSNVATGKTITATATNASSGDTSEFSAPKKVTS
jgi:hypothetical protein